MFSVFPRCAALPARPVLVLIGSVAFHSTLADDAKQIAALSRFVEAAQAKAVIAERVARNAFRTVLARLEGARRRLDLTHRSLARWHSQGQPNFMDYLTLLEKLWHAGEIGTTDYLLQLRQVQDTRMAGEALRGKAWVAWLSATGRVQAWLGIQQEGVVQ